MTDILKGVEKIEEGLKKKANPRLKAFLESVVEEAKKKYPPSLVQPKVMKFLRRPDVRDILDRFENEAFFNFVPRPDDPANFDQQHSFCYNRDSVAFLIGGNAAGTTEAAAFKTALFVLQQQRPPRRDTPFWILSNTYAQVCGTCWQEKLLGHGHIPKSEIDWPRVSWISRAKGWPERVPLLPWPRLKGQREDTNWCLEFKSYDQGREALQARSIGGFWFSEQFPEDVFLETFRGCREYMFPGGQFCEFTPIDPAYCLWIERVMENPPKGWAFYRANTQKNAVNLADGWYDQFFGSVSDEMRDVRLTGALASFEGVIYPEFLPAVHVIDSYEIPDGVYHFRSIDWGASAEHPFVCLWGCVDGEGVWTIYDEYWNTSQKRLLSDHIKEIKTRSIEWGYPAKDDGYNPYFGSCFADPSRPDNINAFNAAGIWIEPAANHVYKGIDCVRAALKVNAATRRPKLRILGHCKHLVEEMRTYRWRRSKKESDGGTLNPASAAPAPLKRNDDTVDALRYMLYSYQCQNGGLAPWDTKRSYEHGWSRGVWGGK